MESPAGTDVEVSAVAPAKVTVFSVAATFGGAPNDAGFMITPLVLPLTVGDVRPNSPAARAGVRPGDQLVSIDGASLQGVLPAGAMTLVFNRAPGATMRLGIVRGGVAHDAELK